MEETPSKKIERLAGFMPAIVAQDFEKKGMPVLTCGIDLTKIQEGEPELSVIVHFNEEWFYGGEES